MRVVVIGAGIIGVTTAYVLRRLGCEVTVVERNSGVAQEASFANGGVIAPGYTGPWSGPRARGLVWRALLGADAAVRIRPSTDPALWRWLRRFLGEATFEHYRLAKRRMHRLASYSQAQMRTLQSRHAIEFERQPGLLQLFRRTEDLERGEPVRNLLAELGVTSRLLDAPGCRTIEPALSDRTPLAGGVHLPQDETGNCAYFARQLKEVAEAEGVQFAFNCAVVALDTGGGRLNAIDTTRGPMRADACVLAAGTDSTALLAGSGIGLPLLPVRGLSATIPIIGHEPAPRVAVMDEEYKVVVARMGKRLRIAGTAVIGARDTRVRPREAATLLKVASDWYPGVAHYSKAQLWAGLRPMLPDGPPVLGRTPVSGLYLNLGHGSSGWAMACGAARVVGDIVTGRAPEIDLEGLTLERFAAPALRQARPALSTS